MNASFHLQVAYIHFYRTVYFYPGNKFFNIFLYFSISSSLVKIHLHYPITAFNPMQIIIIVNLACFKPASMKYKYI